MQLIAQCSPVGMGSIYKIMTETKAKLIKTVNLSRELPDSLKEIADNSEEEKIDVLFIGPENYAKHLVEECNSHPKITATMKGIIYA